MWTSPTGLCTNLVHFIICLSAISGTSWSLRASKQLLLFDVKWCHYYRPNNLYHPPQRCKTSPDGSWISIPDKARDGICRSSPTWSWSTNYCCFSAGWKQHRTTVYITVYSPAWWFPEHPTYINLKSHLNILDALIASSGGDELLIKSGGRIANITFLLQNIQGGEKKESTQCLLC